MFLLEWMLDYIPPQDPRTKGWLMVDTWVPSASICLAYVFTVKVLLPRYMRQRAPLDIMSFIRAFNIFQVLANFWFALQVGRRTYFGGGFNWLCQGVMGRDDKPTLDLLRLFYSYIWVRVVDLLDTVFFGLRHKWTHVSTLNVSHHCIVLLFGVYGVRHGADSHLAAVVLVNQAVHVLMFTYYFFASFGDRFRKYLTWKRYLTGVQLAQFAVLGVHSVLPLLRPCPGLPIMHSMVGVSTMMFFFLMFLRFYLVTYRQQPLLARRPSPLACGECTPWSAAGHQPRSSCPAEHPFEGSGKVTLRRSGENSACSAHSKTGYDAAELASQSGRPSTTLEVNRNGTTASGEIQSTRYRAADYYYSNKSV